MSHIHCFHSNGEICVSIPKHDSYFVFYPLTISEFLSLYLRFILLYIGYIEFLFILSVS